jgi:tetrapyrrole methylase family protein/MazG family protein
MPEKPYRPGLPAVFDVVHRLRAPDGCPWDREQTHESLRQYLLEETYEALEAIDSGDDDKLREELGDVLLQVAMHAEIAAQEGRFTAADVSEAVAAKMVTRHPHVFGDASAHDAEEVLRNWEQQKASEAKAQGRASETALDRVPRTLPALAWTLGLQKRAARVGFDFASAEDAARDVAEEAGELAGAAARAAALGSEASRGSSDASSPDPAPAPRDDEEIGEDVFHEVGDLLFAVVNLSRKLKVNPEDALRVAGQRFMERYKAMDSAVRESGRSFREMSAEELEEAWAATR